MTRERGRQNFMYVLLGCPWKVTYFWAREKKVFYCLYLLLCNFIRKSSILSLSFMFSLLSLSTLDSDACSWCSVWRSLSVSASWSNVFVCSSLFSSATVFLSDKSKKKKINATKSTCHAMTKTGHCHKRKRRVPFFQEAEKREERANTRENRDVLSEKRNQKKAQERAIPFELCLSFTV